MEELIQAENVAGLGDLYFYDVAFRIAAFLGDDRLPEGAYLHTGALAGAKLLNFPKRAYERGYLLSSEWARYPELDGFEPWEIEDILCFHHNCYENFYRDLA